MTRYPSRHLLALALAAALVSPAVAQDAQEMPAAAAPQAPASSAFTVSDIRVDGLQRIGAGTVFTYLPIERGDRVDQTRVGEAIRALYRTGFFEDVAIGRQGDILVVSVTERPAINTLTLSGNKDIKTEDLMQGLREIGLAEGAASTTSRSRPRSPTWTATGSTSPSPSTRARRRRSATSTSSATSFTTRTSCARTGSRTPPTG